jgi:hypothetical protein
MNIERIKTTFQRAGWQIVAAPENVTPAGTLYGQGPGGDGVLTIRGDGSGASVQLPMHRGMTEAQAKQSILFGRLLVATLPAPINATVADWYDRSIVAFARTVQRGTSADGVRATKTAKTNTTIVSTIEWQPQNGKLIVKIEEQTT